MARHEGKEESEGEAEVGIFHQHRHYLLMQQQQQFFNGLLPPPGFLLQQLQRGGHEQPGPGRQPQAHGQEEPQGRVEEEDKGTDACLSAFERQVLASFSAAAAAAAALPKAPSSSPGPYDGIWKSNPSHNVPLTTVAGSHSVEGLAGSAMHYHGAF